MSAADQATMAEAERTKTQRDLRDSQLTFERRAKDFMFGVANSRKARMGGLAGLQDPDMLAAKMAMEKKLRGAAAIAGHFVDVREWK